MNDLMNVQICESFQNLRSEFSNYIFINFVIFQGLVKRSTPNEFKKNVKKIFIFGSSIVFDNILMRELT